MLSEEHLLLITDAARDVANSWPDVLLGDLVNEMAVRWLESWQSHDGKRVTVRTYLEDEDVEQGAKKLAKTLRRWAYSYCRAETAAIRGHDDYTPYRRELLKELLPLLDDDVSWSSLAASSAQSGARKLPSEGSDMLAIRADLAVAFDKLPARDRTLLRLRYVEERPDWAERAVELYGISLGSTRQLVSRAMGRLEKLMAGKPSATTGRKAMSNLQAQEILREQY